MHKQEKRRVGEDAASEQPRGEPETRQAQCQSASYYCVYSLTEFPREALIASERWHRQQVMQATSISALKYHVRLMIARRALVMLDVHDAWPDCYPAVIQGAVKLLAYLFGSGQCSCALTAVRLSPPSVMRSES